MHNTGCLGLVHWDDPEGWNGEGGGRRVQDGEHMYNNHFLNGFTSGDLGRGGCSSFYIESGISNLHSSIERIIIYSHV